MVLAEALVMLGAGILRSVSGWLENSLKDLKIEKFEWKQLGATVLRLVVLSLGLSLGFEVDATTAAGLGLATDFVLTGVKTKRK